MEPQDEALLNFVNGRSQNPMNDLLILVTANYLVLSDSAKAKLQELAGAVHEWNKSPENGQKQPS